MSIIILSYVLQRLHVQIVALDAAFMATSGEIVLPTADLQPAAAAALTTGNYRLFKLKLQSTAAVNTDTVIDTAALPLQYVTDIR
jgi:hypothetical protein